MAQFKAFATGVEVNGQTVLSIIDGMSAISTFKTMAKNILLSKGIVDPKPDKWYPQQAWLDAFKEISVKIGAQTLCEIGRKIPENAEWPPSVNSIETALASIDVAYHMNHRINGQIMFNPANGKMLEGIGHYGFEIINAKKIQMICKNPYASDFDRGIIEAAAKKFKPAGVFVSVKVTDDQRKNGGESSTYTIEW